MKTTYRFDATSFDEVLANDWVSKLKRSLSSETNVVITNPININMPMTSVVSNGVFIFEEIFMCPVFPVPVLSAYSLISKVTDIFQE